MQSRTPDQFFSAHADFWTTAAQDYAKEIAALTDLTTEETSELVTAAQFRPEDVGAVALPWKKAA
jgi:hypothetical protein